MKMTKDVLVTLAILLAASECYLPLFKRQENSAPSVSSASNCGGRLTPCNELFSAESLRVINNISSLRTLVENITSICSLYREAADCLQPLMEDCSAEFPIRVVIKVAGGAYLCSDRARSLLGQANTSKCYNNETQLEPIQGLRDRCFDPLYAALQLTNHTFCQIAVKDVFCTRNASVQQCGESVGNFISEQYGSILSVFYPLCGLDNTQAIRTPDV
ncbi:hypothetical protein BsWGS_23410 [Bradybaena similaris]